MDEHKRFMLFANPVQTNTAHGNIFVSLRVVKLAWQQQLPVQAGSLFVWGFFLCFAVFNFPWQPLNIRQGGMKGLMEHVICRPTQEWGFLTVHTFHTLTHFAAPAAKGCEEPWKRLLPPPTHTQCDRDTQEGAEDSPNTQSGSMTDSILCCHQLILTMGKSSLPFRGWILKMEFSRAKGSEKGKSQSYLSVYLCHTTLTTFCLMTNVKRTECLLLKGHLKGHFESTATSKQLTTKGSSVWVQVKAVKGKSQSPGKDRRRNYTKTYQGMTCAALGQHDLGGKKEKRAEPIRHRWRSAGRWGREMTEQKEGLTGP